MAQQRLTIPGPAGQLELAIDRPPAAQAVNGLAVLAHPHPLFGGTLDNKVMQTLVRAFLELGMVCVRPNFRGVGQSEGLHDDGQGEQEDLWATWSWAEAAFSASCGPRRWQAGFSFGACMSSHIAQNWAQQRAARGLPARDLDQLVLVGFAPERIPPAPLPADALVIHGEHDDVASLQSVLDFARPTKTPVLVLPGAGHFFHGMLIELRDLLMHQLGPRP